MKLGSVSASPARQPPALLPPSGYGFCLRPDDLVRQEEWGTAALDIENTVSMLGMASGMVSVGMALDMVSDGKAKGCE